MKSIYQQSTVNQRWTSGQTSQNHFEKLPDDVIGGNVRVPPLQGLSNHNQKGVRGRTSLFIAGFDAKNSLRDEAIHE